MDWKKFLFSFEGRISRKAYWLAIIAMIVISVILQVVALGPMMSAAMTDPEAAASMSMPIWLWIIMIPMIWISLAVYAKRWHDTDKSGWFTLLMLIPLVGFIVMIVLGCLTGTPGPNRFGEGPMA